MTLGVLSHVHGGELQADGPDGAKRAADRPLGDQFATVGERVTGAAPPAQRSPRQRRRSRNRVDAERRSPAPPDVAKSRSRM